MTDLGWVTIPTGEFEALHWEIRNGTASLQALQRGYNTLYAEAQRSELEAEALIAYLRVERERLQTALERIESFGRYELQDTDAYAMQRIAAETLHAQEP